MKSILFTAIAFGLFAACNPQPATEKETASPETEQQEPAPKTTEDQMYDPEDMPGDTTELYEDTADVEIDSL